MEYLNFKSLLRKRKYNELDEEYENYFINKKAKNSDIVEGGNDLMVKSVLSSVAVLNNTNSRKKRSRNKNRSVSKLWWEERSTSTGLMKTLKIK